MIAFPVDPPGQADVWPMLGTQGAVGVSSILVALCRHLDGSRCPPRSLNTLALLRTRTQLVAAAESA